MKADASFEPQLARILREQARARRLAAFAERRAVALCGGDKIAGRWPKSRGSAQRGIGTPLTAAGVACLCGESGCESCGSTGKTGRRYGCGRVGCSSFSAVGSRGASGGARRAITPPAPSRIVVNPNPGGPVIVVPDPWIEPPEIVTPPRETEPFSAEYFDIHSHNFCSTKADWAEGRDDTRDRIARLLELADEGIGRMAISGQADPTAGGDFIDDSAMINEITWFATEAAWNYFVPFAQILPGEIVEGVGEDVAGWLADGFEGVGELFVHGHEEDIDDNRALLEICRIAALHGVPVLVHWDFGNTDLVGDPPRPIRDPADNFAQLVALLDAFPKAPVEGYGDTQVPPLKLIIAHCGTGPGDMDDAALTRYKERLEFLLSNEYPNVWFDLAGMQVADERKLYTGVGTRVSLTLLGDFLLNKIAEHPERFLFGVDTENRFEDDTFAEGRLYWGSTTYAASVRGYATFLSSTASGPTRLSAEAQAMVKRESAFRVLYSKPIVLSRPTTSGSTYSTSAAWPP